MSEVHQSHLNKAHDDKFLLVFDVPNILKSKSSTTERSNKTIIPDSVQFSVFGTAVPEIVVPAIETRMTGSTLYVSSHSKNPYPPVAIGFNVDSEYNNYWTIYKWLDLLHDQYYGRYNSEELESSEIFSDYQTDLTIYGMDGFNKKKIKFTYTKAFPTAINDITYDYKEGAELISGFRFVYSQLHTEII